MALTGDILQKGGLLRVRSAPSSSSKILRHTLRIEGLRRRCWIAAGTPQKRISRGLLFLTFPREMLSQFAFFSHH